MSSIHSSFSHLGNTLPRGGASFPLWKLKCQVLSVTDSLITGERTYDPGITSQKHLPGRRIGTLWSNKEELCAAHSGAGVGSRALGKVWWHRPGYKVEYSSGHREGKISGSQCLVMVTEVSSPDSLCRRVSAVVWLCFSSPFSYPFFKVCSSAFPVTLIPVLPECGFYLDPAWRSPLVSTGYFSLILPVFYHLIIN